ncbi:hypothetical protein, partial [Atlantibacter hermannii]|uniref:hypothetical protein n=1 Tax=Atlantibacter hermannii TaxID=565 RepID=UPI002897A908
IMHSPMTAIFFNDIVANPDYQNCALVCSANEKSSNILKQCSDNFFEPDGDPETKSTKNCQKWLSPEHKVLRRRADNPNVQVCHPV